MAYSGGPLALLPAQLTKVSFCPPNACECGISIHDQSFELYYTTHIANDLSCEARIQFALSSMWRAEFEIGEIP